MLIWRFILSSLKQHFFSFLKFFGEGNSFTAPLFLFQTHPVYIFWFSVRFVIIYNFLQNFLYFFILFCLFFSNSLKPVIHFVYLNFLPYSFLTASNSYLTSVKQLFSLFFSLSFSFLHASFCCIFAVGSFIWSLCYFLISHLWRNYIFLDLLSAIKNFKKIGKWEYFFKLVYLNQDPLTAKIGEECYHHYYFTFLFYNY